MRVRPRGTGAPSNGPLARLPGRAALGRALADAASLRTCAAAASAPTRREPSPARAPAAPPLLRFAACSAATVAAAVMQDVLGVPPPYPLLSVPVMIGAAAASP